MKQLQQAWLIAMKDLKIFMSDRGATFFFIIFPIMFIVLFNFIMKGVGGNDQRLTLHMVTQEPESGISSQIIGSMVTANASALKPGDPQIIRDKDYNADLQAVKDKKLSGFVAFPADFTQTLMAGGATGLQVVADESDVNTRAALNGLADSIASQIATDIISIRASVQLLIQSGAISSTDNASINSAIQGMIGKEFAGGSAGGQSGIAFKTQSVGPVIAENPSNWVIPGYLTMFVFFAAAIMAESIVRERKNHTLERLLASSIKRETILGGIFTGAVVRGLVQIIIFWLLGILVFKVDLGFAPGAVML
ncbi:MAG TPA: ABC transporter permease, partial [Dehalococcoidales bacterium]|nr:ABC transporter permease [Dehalococcoidales bacterium]